MNILFLNSVPVHVFGGIEYWTGMVSRGLLSRGHNVTIAGRPGSEYLRRNRNVHPNLRIIELPVSGDFNPVTIAALCRIYRNSHIDVVIANFNKDIRLGGIAARLTGDVKVVWRAGLDQTKNNLVHRLLTPRLLDGVITPSHRLKQQIVASGYIPDSLVTPIHTGLPDCDQRLDQPSARQMLHKKYKLPGDALVIVTSGRFVDQKGHVYLAKAIPGIVRECPNAYFLWLGDGPLEAVLKTRLQESGCRDRVVFAGLLESFDLELQGADIMAHPSIEEPFGIVLLEGMRAGLPIVASRVGGIPEVVAEGETAMLVPPHEPVSLRDAILALLSDPDKRATMGAAGRERWRSCFRYDVMLDNLETRLKELVGPGDQVASSQSRRVQ